MFILYKMVLLQVQGPALSKQEVEDLLKRGAYGAIMDEDDDAKKFCEEDIDQILQRRAHTITIESGVKGSTFSKVGSWLISKTNLHFKTDVNFPYIQRLALFLEKTALTFLWMIQTFGRNGQRKLTWILADLKRYSFPPLFYHVAI